MWHSKSRQLTMCALQLISITTDDACFRCTQAFLKPPKRQRLTPPQLHPQVRPTMQVLRPGKSWKQSKPSLNLFTMLCLAPWRQRHLEVQTGIMGHIVSASFCPR